VRTRTKKPRDFPHRRLVRLVRGGGRGGGRAPKRLPGTCLRATSHGYLHYFYSAAQVKRASVPQHAGKAAAKASESSSSEESSEEEEEDKKKKPVQVCSLGCKDGLRGVVEK
jgi:hypothetical protein